MSCQCPFRQARCIGFQTIHMDNGQRLKQSRCCLPVLRVRAAQTNLPKHIPVPCCRQDTPEQFLNMADCRRHRGSWHSWRCPSCTDNDRKTSCNTRRTACCCPDTLRQKHLSYPCQRTAMTAACPDRCRLPETYSPYWGACDCGHRMCRNNCDRRRRDTRGRQRRCPYSMADSCCGKHQSWKQSLCATCPASAPCTAHIPRLSLCWENCNSSCESENRRLPACTVQVCAVRQ